MAWSYYDYEEQTSNALRLARLRLHISEVNAKIRANMTSGDQQNETDPLVKYLADVLEPRRRELEQRAGEVDADDPRVTAGFTAGRPL